MGLKDPEPPSATGIYNKMICIMDFAVSANSWLNALLGFFVHKTASKTDETKLF